MKVIPQPETVQRVAEALARHTELPFDETSDDMTVQFAIKLADADRRQYIMRAALRWIAANGMGQDRKVAASALTESENV